MLCSNEQLFILKFLRNQKKQPIISPPFYLLVQMVLVVDAETRVFTTRLTSLQLVANEVAASSRLSADRYSSNQPNAHPHRSRVSNSAGSLINEHVSLTYSVFLLTWEGYLMSVAFHGGYMESLTPILYSLLLNAKSKEDMKKFVQSDHLSAISGGTAGVWLRSDKSLAKWGERLRFDP